MYVCFSETNLVAPKIGRGVEPPSVLDFKRVENYSFPVLLAVSQVCLLTSKFPINLLSCFFVHLITVKFLRCL